MHRYAVTLEAEVEVIVEARSKEAAGRKVVKSLKALDAVYIGANSSLAIFPKLKMTKEVPCP